jgi:hypothetical protein
MSEQESRYTERDGPFDELAKGLATGTVSRRKALRMFGAALVGGTLASIPGMAWAARPTCPSGVRCRGKCCEVGATCVKGAGGGCACPTGQIVCGGACVSTTCAHVEDVFNPVSCQCERPLKCCSCHNPTNPVCSPEYGHPASDCLATPWFDADACHAHCTTQHFCGFTQSSFMPNATCAVLSDGTTEVTDSGFVCKSNETGCPSGTTACTEYLDGGAYISYCVSSCPSGTNLDPVDCRCK